jgi:flagellar basal body-associated protein FliL
VWFVLKRIILLVLLVLITASMGIAIAVPLAVKASATAAAAPPPAGYLYTLKASDKENYIITTLADRRLVRLQLVLELNESFAPKDLKNPDRKLLVLQDSLLRFIRACQSTELSAQNEQIFKKKVAETATHVLGKNSVRSVYVTGLTID